MSELNREIVLEYLNNVKPSPHKDLICKWEDVFYGISLHTRGARPSFNDLSRENGSTVIPPCYLGTKYQELFERFLMTRHPREDRATRNWRYSQYRPFTKAPFGMLTDILKGAIFQDSQYTLQLPNNDDNAYIWGNNFNGKNIITYFAEVILPSLMEDPNGVEVRIPSQAWFEQQGDRIEIDIFYVNSKDIIYFGKKDIVFKRGNAAYWINDLTIFRFPSTNNRYEVDGRGYYAHMLGHLPVSVGGGIWNTGGYYDSYYDKAKAPADEFISSFSAEQMVDKEASHPFITQLGEDCIECHGIGEISLPDMESGQHKLVKCPKCKGRKRMSNNPADRLEVPIEDWEKVGQHGGTKITNPDVGINKHHREKNTQVMNMILQALNLLNVDAAQSGTAKAIDQEKLYTFTSMVSNNLFDNLILPTIQDIIAYRNVTATATGSAPYVYDFTLIKPTQFQIKTASDLLLELTDSTKGNIPGFIRKKQVVEFVDKRFAGDDTFQRKTEVITELDDLFVYTPDEQMTMRTSGIVGPQDLIYSRKLPSVLDELIREKGSKWFKGAEIDDIKALVDKLMKPFLVVKTFELRDSNGDPKEDDET